MRIEKLSVLITRASVTLYIRFSLGSTQQDYLCLEEARPITWVASWEKKFTGFPCFFARGNNTDSPINFVHGRYALMSHDKAPRTPITLSVRQKLLPSP